MSYTRVTLLPTHQINPVIIELAILGVQTLFLVHLAGCLWHWAAILSLPEDEPARSQAL